MALWQARFVAQSLELQSVETEVVPIETRGDKILNVSIAKIGSKGVFTEELETLLSEGQIDIAVHSAKDLPSLLPDGFEIIAFTSREKVNDVLVSDHPIDFNQPGLVVGTSSTRRIAMFRRYYPHWKTQEIRGNLQTRIEKMRSGTFDALALAYAGVHRMEYDSLIQAELDSSKFTPAVGQGSLAIEAYHSLNSQKLQVIRDALNDAQTEEEVLTERSFLKTLEGGCSIPVFGLAHKSDKTINLVGGVISLDGKELVAHKLRGHDPEKIGKSLAQEILAQGGKEILDEIKNNENK